MPPATPSPHRFLSTNRKAKSTPKEAKPSSSLRRELPQVAAEDRSVAQYSQFAQAPRFSYGKARTSTESERPASPANPTLVQALRATARPTEDVEDRNPTEEGDEMLLDGPELPASVDDQLNPEEQWNGDLPFSPKKRKIDHMSAQQPTIPKVSEDQPASRSRFAQLTQSPVVTDTGDHQRPAFIRPTVQPQEPTEPLPDAFSPHRRGQKFIAGGVAATLQQLVLETGQAAVQGRKGQEYLRGEDYILRAKVEEVNGAGPFVAQAKLSNGDSINLLLAASTNNSGLAARDVHPGSIVGVRAPTWNLDLDSTTYTVGVDWRLIS